MLAAAFLGITVILTVSAVGHSLQLRDEMVEPTGKPKPQPADVPKIDASEVASGPVLAEVDVVGAEERDRLTEALVHALERFDVHRSDLADEADNRDPGALMEELAAELRYTGPLLSEEDRRALEDEPSHDAKLALLWDEHIRKFAADRPLPADFRSRELGSRVALLAWSFHLDKSREASGQPGRLSAAETVHALAESLAVDVALRSGPIVDQYPALASYLAFLGRLPRR